MKLVSGNSNRNLAENIGKYLNTPLADCTVKKFSDKEIFIEKTFQFTWFVVLDKFQEFQ